MADQTTAKPIPVPTPETKVFWDRANEGELWLQRSVQTGTAYFPPRPFFPGDPTQEVEWFRAGGNARLLSYVINYRAAPGFPREPYVIALVELEEGVRMMGNLVDIEADPAVIDLDMPLQVVFERRSETVAVPVWRPAV